MSVSKADLLVQWQVVVVSVQVVQHEGRVGRGLELIEGDKTLVSHRCDELVVAGGFLHGAEGTSGPAGEEQGREPGLSLSQHFKIIN